MNTNEDVYQTLTNFSALKEQLALLGLAGLAGAFTRAILAPEKEWRRRVVQGVVGAMSAIFLGGLMAQSTSQVVGVGPYPWLAWGFIMGQGGEVAVKYVQDRLLGGYKDDDSSK